MNEDRPYLQIPAPSEDQRLYEEWARRKKEEKEKEKEEVRVIIIDV